jgi:Tfp pilus assembly major pilin PilA
MQRFGENVGVRGARGIDKQAGVSLSGFLFVLVIVGLIAVLALKVVPTVVEYSAVKKAVTTASTAGSTPSEIRAAFDRQRSANYIDSVSGRDLEIVKTETGFDVSVSYQRKIPLAGPASLVLDYEASSRKR